MPARLARGYGAQHGRAALLLLVFGCASCLADNLSEIPPALATRLEPVPAVSLDRLDADSRAQLQSARARVDRLMQGKHDLDSLADAWGELGALYHVHNVHRLAQTCYRNALELSPANFRWAYYHAYLAHETGDLDAAERRYRAARAIRPGYLALTARLAEVLLDRNDLQGARAAYLHIIESPGLDAAAHYGLGQLALLERNYPDASAHFRKALALQPDADYVHYPLAQALRSSGNSEEAARHLALRGDQQPVIHDPQIDSLMALRQGAHIHFIHGMAAMRKADFTAARAAFAAGLAREPANSNARISYARTLYLVGDRQAARAELEQVVAADNAIAMAWYLLGVLDEVDGKPATALQHYRNALRHDPDHAGAHFNLGNLHYRDARYPDAVRHYAASARTAPENAAAWLPYIGAALSAGQGRNTVLAINGQALQRFPGHLPLAYLQIQLLACDTDDTACNAEQALEQASSLHAKQAVPPHRELLALAQAAAGESAAAVATQEGLLAEAMLAAPGEVARLDRVLAGYREDRLPQDSDLFTAALLQPPAVDAVMAFRHYPTARPY